MQTIFRAKLSTEFTTLPNVMLRNKSLSYRARGLLAMVLTFPGDWVVHKDWLIQNGTEGRTAVDSALTELRSGGFCRLRQRKNKDTGLIEAHIWVFSDTPMETSQNPNVSPEADYPAAGYSTSGKPATTKTVQNEDGKTGTSSASAGAGSEGGKKEKAPSTDFIQLRDMWIGGYLERFGQAYLFQGGKDGKAIKTLLKTGLSVGQIMSVANECWTRSGFPFGGAASLSGLAGHWNEIRAALASMEGSVVKAPLKPTWTHLAALAEQVAKHPANPERYATTNPPSPEQKKEFSELKKSLADMKVKFAASRSR